MKSLGSIINVGLRPLLGKKMTINHQVIERSADAIAGLSITSAVTSWAVANEIAQLIATIIAAISGAVAIAYHIWRWRKEASKKRR